jgi:quercetin dioxygenase-like cupin family protein
MAVRVRSGNLFPYDLLMEREGLPIHGAVVGVDDVTALPRGDWPRTGGKGTFIQLQGTFEAQRGIYIAEIPGGGALNPEKHLYEEEVFVLQGRGLAEAWQGSGPKLMFEWGTGSVFAFPRNVSHRLYNGGQEPVLFMGVTTAPALVNAMDEDALDLIYNADVECSDLYAAGDKYFTEDDHRTTEGWYKQGTLYTRFIGDARRLALDALEQKVAGGLLTGYRMGWAFPWGHVSQWPAGRYHKAHYHGPGAILLGLDGEGYVLAWPSALGPRPYQDGHGDQVHKVRWGRNSIYSPPNAYFHQHFNTGPDSAKHVAVYGPRLPLGVHNLEGEEGWRGYLSYREGGTLIEYEDEDPRVRRDFEAELAQRGISCQMPAVDYR